MTRAPRPYLVRPKTPLFQRTGTKVVLVVLGWSLVFLLLVLAGAQTKADDRRDQISEFSTLVQAQLYQSGAAQQSFPGPLVLPELGQAVSELQSGEVKNPDEVATNAERWADVATQAGNNVGQVEAEGLALTEARNLMKQGLLLYAGLADE
ncbi:MAG: hypothetical protein ACRDHB_01450, partial [Actinomycetota bacterium]